MSSLIPNPPIVNLDDVDQAAVVCYFNVGDNEYNGMLGARVSAIFVILFVSTAATVFPVLSTRVRWLKIPLYVYLFARYFGTGVIIATGFIHLLDPSYGEIGPASCVGMTGHWAEYTWPPSIALTSGMLTFLMDVVAEYYVESKYGLAHSSIDPQNLVTNSADNQEHRSHQQLHSGDQDLPPPGTDSSTSKLEWDEWKQIDNLNSEDVLRGFQQQIAAFLILEFGVIFHSVIIGLNLGVVGDEFKTLYPVLVFHQSFEGLGIGARLSAIPFPSRLRWMPWALCIAYGLTTPISIAIGLGLRTTYNSGSFTANVVSGVLDATSAGILIYTGLVELLARDFLFNPNRTRDKKRLAFMLASLYLGTALMALLGKWA